MLLLVYWMCCELLTVHALLGIQTELRVLATALCQHCAKNNVQIANAVIAVITRCAGSVGCLVYVLLLMRDCHERQAVHQHCTICS
jgi:hypothetical protein